jgi:hypothetical protein
MTTYRLEFIPDAPERTRDWFMDAPGLPPIVQNWRDAGCVAPLALTDESVGPVRDWLDQVWYREEHRPIRLVADEPGATLDRDESVKIDLDPDDALAALLKVDPQAEPVEDDPAPPHGDPPSSDP